MQSDAAVAVSVDEYLPAGQARLSKEKKEKKEIRDEGTSVVRGDTSRHATAEAAKESEHH